MTRTKGSDSHDGLCGAITRKGTPCEQPAGFGTDHVGVGTCKFHLGATATHSRAASKELARREAMKLGLEIETTPADALIHAVWEAAGNVAYYRTQLDDLDGAIHNGEKPHVVLELYNGERDRLRDTAAAALRAGVEERRVRIAEADAERIVSAQRAALTDMGLGDRLGEFRERFNTHLGAGDEPAHLGSALNGA